MKKWRKGIKRILAVAVAVVLMGGSVEWSTLQVAAAEMNEPILAEEGENTDLITVEREPQIEYIELPELETSAMPMMLFALDANGKVPLKNTKHANWIDRLDLTGADYAMTFYNWLIENSDNDGTEDALIDPTATNSTVKSGTDNNSNTIYYYLLKEFTGTVDFTYAANATNEEIEAAADAVLSPILTSNEEKMNEVAKYTTAVYSAFDRDYPQVFWLNETSMITTSTQSGYSYGGGSGTATYIQTVGFMLKSSDFDIREAGYTNATTIKTDITTVNSQVSTIMSGAASKTTNYEKAKYFNEWLTVNNCYNTSADLENAGHAAHECISALKGSVSTSGPVCEGYARAFKVLCDQAGIPCVLVDGDADNGSGTPEAHMWNYVQMDGKWYAVDVTWNDPTTNSTEAKSGSENEDYFLVGSDTLIGGNEGAAFDASHIMKNTVTMNGVAFINEPEIETSAYAPEQPCTHPTGVYVASGATITENCGTCSVELGKATISAANENYNGAPITASVEKAGTLANQTMDITYKVKGGAVLGSEPVSAGTYIASITLGEGVDAKTASVEFTIAKINLTYTAPTANELTYSGTAQSLVTAGGVQDAEMQYSLEQNGTYSTTIPTGTEAGDYTVWYKIVGGENYNDVEPSSVAVTIGKATPAISVEVSSGNLSPGSSVVIGTSAKNPNNEELTDTPSITCTYQIGDGEASAFTNGFSIPKGTAVGTVITITASTAEDANYAAATKTITVTVEACNHTGGTQTCKGYQCANCGEWYGAEGTHVPDKYGKCTIEGCDKQYEAKIGNYDNTDISCFYDKITDAYNPGGNQAILHVLADVILTEDAVLGGFYRMYMNGHTITLNDGNTLTFLGVHVHGEGRIIGNVEGPLVINNGGPDWTRININNSHANGYAMQVNQSINGGLVLNGSKADILLPSEEARVGIDIYEENQVFRIAYAEGVDPIGAWLWVPPGGGYERSVLKHYELVSPQGYVLVEEYEEITGYATGIRVKKPITADMVTISPAAGSYGETHSPTIVVTYKNETLVQGRDYTVETPANMSGIGSYTYTITGNGDRFVGKVEVKYTVNKANISGANINLDLNETLYYNGGAITPAVGSVVLNNTTLVKDTDYTVSYTNNTNAGIATVTITGMGNYTGTASTTFTINKATPVVTVPTAKDLTYSGQTQALVNAGSTTGGTIQYSTLENGTYSTNIPEATDVGTYTVWYKVVGGSNYQDIEAQSIAIEIIPREVTVPVFADMEEAYSYTGNAVEPAFTLKDGDTVIPATEYEVRYQNNVNVGIASIVITDKTGGNYTISGTKSFPINKAQPNISVVPTVTERTYHPSKALENSDLSGGIALGVDGGELEGSWSFSNTGIVPNAGSNSYEVTFTPEDTVNYTEVTAMVTVTVNKAVATVGELPVASAIVYGDTLEASTFSGGKMVCGNVIVPGTYEWVLNGTSPTVADSNSTTYSVVFVPEDTTNYECVEMKVSLTVKKADPVVELSRVFAAYGQTLQDIALPQGWEWEEESASVGNAGTNCFNAIYTPADTDNYNVITREITVDVMAAGLRVVSVQTSDRVYDGTKNVQVTGVTLTGILGSDEVYVQIPDGGLTGILESADAGTYTKVQLPQLTLAGADAGNYTIAQAEYNITDVTISKAPSYTVADVNKAYVYTKGTEGTEEISIAQLLKSDRGNTDYRLTAWTTNFTGGQNINKTGMLSYVVDTTGNIGDTDTITVTATSKNYEDVTVKVIITLTDKAATENKVPSSNPMPTISDPGKPFIQDETGKIGWVVIEEELKQASPGEAVIVNMNGATIVPGNIFEEIKGQNITIVLLMDNGISWTVNGKDVAKAKDIDLAVTVATETNPVNNIPVQVLNKVTGEKYHVNISLKHNGELGMKAVLHINLDPKNEGLFANLFYYNAAKKNMQFVWADDIDASGVAQLVFEHASEYSIVIDKEIMLKSATAVKTGDNSISPVILAVIMLVSVLVASGIFLYLYKGKHGKRRERMK